MVTQRVRNKYPHFPYPTEKQQKEGATICFRERERVFSCREFQSSPPDKLHISLGAQGIFFLAVNVGGLGGRGGREKKREEEEECTVAS